MYWRATCGNPSDIYHGLADILLTQSYNGAVSSKTVPLVSSKVQNFVTEEMRRFSCYRKVDRS